MASKATGSRELKSFQSSTRCERELSGLDVFVLFTSAARGREAPGAEIDGVKGDAEEIGGDEAELGGANTDHADDGAINGGNDPALPKLLAEQNGPENGQNAGDVIQSNIFEHSGPVV